MRLGTQLYKRMKKIWLMLGLNSQNLSFKDLGRLLKQKISCRDKSISGPQTSGVYHGYHGLKVGLHPKTSRKFITGPHRESNRCTVSLTCPRYKHDSTKGNYSF